jgi:hypothetical protein
MITEKRQEVGLQEHYPEKWAPVFGKDHAQAKMTSNG